LIGDYDTSDEPDDGH